MSNNEFFKEGKKAYFKGKTKGENPYELYSEEFNQWVKGFKAGEKEDVDQDPDGN